MDRINKKAFESMITASEAESTGVKNLFGEKVKQPSLSSAVHGTLGVAGMIPGIGVVPDLVDAGIYALEKDPVGVGLSLAAAIPGAGLVAGGGKLAKMSKTAKKLDNLGFDIVDIATEFNAYSKATGILIKKHGLDPDSAINLMSLHRDMRKGFTAADEAANFLKNAGQSVDSVHGTGSAARALRDEKETLDWLRNNPEWIDKIGLRELKGFKKFEGYLKFGDKVKVGQIMKEI